MTRSTFALVSAALALVQLSAGPASGNPGACIEDWSEAALIVQREGLIPTREIQLMAKARHASDIVRITLCIEGAGYVYRLLVRDDRGRLGPMKIDAQPLAGSSRSTAQTTAER